MFYLFAAFLVFSGLASLTYQVAWVRLLGQSLGSTSASISTVLAAFFLGLAAGSYFAERITRNRINSFKPYVVLEVLIGLSGLCLLPVLLNLDLVLSWFPAFGTELTLKFLLTVVILAIPTTCMGATFPVMAAILVRRRKDMGNRISQLYSLNTLGAVLGACLSGFFLIPNFGLDGSVHIAVLLNLGVAAGALLVDRNYRLPPHEITTDEPARAARDVAPASASFTQLVAAITLAATGFIAIATQVGWTKYLAIFTGSTIYGFSAILTVFLIGITTGSWVIRKHIDSISAPQNWMAAGLALLAYSLILARVGLGWLPDVQLAINDIRASDGITQFIRYAAVGIIIFPPTFLFGALFPINLKLYCGSLDGVQKRVGKAYAINTVASIFGAIFAGFWIIPEYGTNTLLTGLAVAAGVLCAVWLPVLATPVIRYGAIGLAVGVAWVALWTPQIDYRDMIKSVEYSFDRDEEPKFLFLKEGKAGVISLVTTDDELAVLQNNGLSESGISLVDAKESSLIENLLGMLPYLLHPEPKKAFVLGYGGGITTRVLAGTALEHIRIVELEPAVVEAGRVIEDGPHTVLEDPRVVLQFNDARNTLLVENARYDLIVSQPSHPWRAGTANVFTTQFWQIADGQLEDDGIFSQWINLFQMDTGTLKSLFNSFYDVFPHGFSIADMDSGDLLLIGSKAPVLVDYDRMNTVLSTSGIKELMANIDVSGPNDILWYFALSRREALEASRGAPQNTDTNLLSEVRLSTLLTDPEGNDSPYTFLQETATMDLAPILGKDPAQKLYDLSIYAAFWKNDWMVRKLAEQLEGLDPALGRSVMHLRMIRRGEHLEAAKLYARHNEWTRNSHLTQAESYMDTGLFAEAGGVLEKLSPGKIRDRYLARFYYETGHAEKLEKFSDAEEGARIWYLLGLSGSDLKTAALSLLEIGVDENSPVPVLQAVVRYHAAENNLEELNKYAEILAEAVKPEGENQ